MKQDSGSFNFFVRCARQVFKSLNEREKGFTVLRHLVTLGTAGLGNDLLHVLDLPLTAGECAELKEYVSFGSVGFVV